jgi:hypothetical protein
MIPDARALLDVNTHYVTNQPNSQNDGALGQQVIRRSLSAYFRIGSFIESVRSFDIRIITMMRSGWENPARRPRITRRWWAPPGTHDEENQPP